jgi:O-antigen chain-terminating methyltransferase
LAAEIESWSEASRRAVDSLGEELQEKMKLQRWALEGVLFRIQEELRPLRERLAAQARAQATRLETGAQAPRVAAGSFSAAAVDYAALEHKFRGSEEEIRERQGFYVPLFQDRRNVLDVACGRGEFLELMRQAGVPARGVDVDADMIGRCLEKGLEAVQADVFAYLDTVPDSSLDGIFSAHFVEHLEPAAYAALLQQCVSKLAPSGILAIETPNPECLAIFSQSFFLDPTHVRPIPAAQLRFLFTDAGLARISTHFLSPAGAELPLIPPLASYRIEPDVLKAFNAAVAKFNETFFGGMDYAIIGYKPDSASRST